MLHVCLCTISYHRFYLVGNYYSIREQHEHAARYFQRAIKLDPNYIPAWTLMGHEYMEMNNQSAAIRAYRQALGE